MPCPARGLEPRGTALYCIVLNCIVLNCIVLNCIVLNCHRTCFYLPALQVLQRKVQYVLYCTVEEVDFNVLYASPLVLSEGSVLSDEIG